jgi:hypothetical protein
MAVRDEHGAVPRQHRKAHDRDPHSQPAIQKKVIQEILSSEEEPPLEPRTQGIYAKEERASRKKPATDQDQPPDEKTGGASARRARRTVRVPLYPLTRDYEDAHGTHMAPRKIKHLRGRPVYVHSPQNANAIR